MKFWNLLGSWRLLNETYEILKRQVKQGASQGADIALIETMSDLYEMKAAILAVKRKLKFACVCHNDFSKGQEDPHGNRSKDNGFCIRRPR